MRTAISPSPIGRLRGADRGLWAAFALPALGLATTLATPEAARVLWLLAGAPLAEELVFRAGLQAALARSLGRLRQVGRAAAPLAIVLASLAFAAAHAALTDAGPWAWATVLPSLVLGAVYQRGHRLAPCVALHAAFNAIWLSLPWLTPTGWPFHALGLAVR